MKLTPRRNVNRLDEIRPSEFQAKKITRYRECLRNYSASVGGYDLDGCREFVACGEEGTSDALKCATCGCHRNFHRREVEGEPSCSCHRVCDEREQTPRDVPHPALPLPATTVASNGSTDSDDQEGGVSASDAATKRRFRTKFSAEQKEKMCSFAEKLGWKFQKQDEEAVQSFCADVGVKRHALKNWMKNNKHVVGKDFV